MYSLSAVDPDLRETDFNAVGGFDAVERWNLLKLKNPCTGPVPPIRLNPVVIVEVRRF
jgi:hypothetical protein